MRISWADLHSSLKRSLRTAEAVEQYSQLRAEQHVLTPFPSTAALLAHLEVTRHLDEADQIYAALVRAMQAAPRAAPTAHALLMCGLWPGLDRIYRRRRSLRDGFDDLPITLAGTFMLLVGRMDLRTVRRVAATLVRSTARELANAARRARVGTGVALEELAPLHLVDLPAPAVNDEVFRYELADLHRVLQPILGEDTVLLLRVLVLEEWQSTAAERLGLTLHTARKRFQRALHRLRENHQKGER